MKARIRTTISLACVCAALPCQGQGTFQPIHITFDGPPSVLPGTDVGVVQYHEQGMSFTPSRTQSQFGRTGGGISFFPENGTTYLHAAAGDSLAFAFTNGTPFNLNSVELAEYSTVVSNAVTVRFTGYWANGAVLSRDVTTDGIIDGIGPVADFQTIIFQEFRGVTRIEIPTYGWSLDNLWVSQIVPEPTCGTLLVAGALLVWLLRRKSRSRS